MNLNVDPPIEAGLLLEASDVHRIFKRFSGDAPDENRAKIRRNRKHLPTMNDVQQVIAEIYDEAVDEARSRLGIGVTTWRQMANDIREVIGPDDFDYLPRDRRISRSAFRIMELYQSLKKDYSRPSAKRILKSTIYGG